MLMFSRYIFYHVHILIYGVISMLTLVIGTKHKVQLRLIGMLIVFQVLNNQKTKYLTFTLRAKVIKIHTEGDMNV